MRVPQGGTGNVIGRHTAIASKSSPHWKNASLNSLALVWDCSIGSFAIVLIAAIASAIFFLQCFSIARAWDSTIHQRVSEQKGWTNRKEHTALPSRTAQAGSTHARK